ncbi:MAG: hypothetical protein Q4P36_06530 [Bowdeniella nasicola]|nr:hypothetical protein [Bowdeniella nasicola]
MLLYTGFYLPLYCSVRAALPTAADMIRRMDDVATFVRDNTNRALMKLGYPGRFSSIQTEVNPEILAGRPVRMRTTFSSPVRAPHR